MDSCDDPFPRLASAYLSVGGHTADSLVAHAIIKRGCFATGSPAPALNSRDWRITTAMTSIARLGLAYTCQPPHPTR